MKIRYARQSRNETLNVLSFGYSGNPDKTQWGRGSRNVCIVHYILEGYGYFNGHKVSEGNGFIIEPDQIVEYMGSEERPWKYFWIIFDGNESVEICKKHIRSQRGVFEYSFRSRIKLVVDSLFSDDAPLDQSAALSAFFYIISLHDGECLVRSNRYVEQAKDYIDLHFHLNISITDVASHLNISDRYLYNLFVKQEGKSPKQYLTDLRISRAKSLLRDSGYSITEIAVSVGFLDVLSFSKFFSKHAGVSPTAFRKRDKST